MDARTGNSGDLNLTLAFLVHVVGGLFWLTGITSGAAAALGGWLGALWGVTAAALWLLAMPAMIRERERPGVVWLRSFQWWLSTFVAPFVLAALAIRRWQVNRQVLTRLEDLERRLGAVERALERLAGVEPAVPEPEPEPEPEPAPATWGGFVFEQPEPEPPRQPQPLAPTTAALPRREPHPPKPARPRREIDWSAVFGAKGLAVAGGVVTVLGIVFFFALAVNRGWIGPVARVALGSAASLIVFGAGLELRRRYGQLHAPLAAVGAGIAGGYATLLAATALYDLVPQWGALVIAAGIACLGSAVSLAWRNELVAGFGLIGAMTMPALLVFDTGLTTVGTAFVALVLVAAVAVAVVLRWRYLLVAASLVSAPQAMALFGDRAHPDTGLLVLSASFWLVYLAAGIAWQLRGRASAVGAMTSSFVLGSGGFAFYAALALFHGSSGVGRGSDLLAFAAVFGALAAAFLARRDGRDLGSMLAALALAIGAVGVADLLSGGSLTYVWAAEAAVLAWLARRLREIRFQAIALAYLVLAAVHALAVEAPLSYLADPDQHLAAVPSLAAVALAAAIFAASTTTFPAEDRWVGFFGPLSDVFAALRRQQFAVQSLCALVALAAVGVGEADALSGGTLTYVWAAEAAALAWAARRFRDTRVQLAALGYLALGFGHALSFEAPVSRLFVVSDHPGAGIPSLLAIALASAVVAFATAEWTEEPRWRGAWARLNGAVAALRREQFALRVGTAALAVLLVIEAISLALLEGYVRWWPGSVDTAFAHGHVALTGLWSGTGLLAVAVGLRRRGRSIAAAGLVWLAVALVKTLAFDAAQLGTGLHSYAFLEVAGAWLAAAVLVQAVRPQLWPDVTVSYLAVGTSLALTLVALAALLDGRLWRIDLQGAAFLGVAALYGAVAAGFFPRPAQRNFSTLLWVLAAAVAAAAEAQLVAGQWRVALWAASGAAIAVLAWRSEERRFQLAALAYLGIAAVVSLVTQATLLDLFSASRHPGDGVPGLVAVVLACFVAARLCHVPDRPALDPLDAALDRQQARWRARGTWVATGLAVYGFSLTILEVAEWVGQRDVTTNFQSGHTAVSAMWGALGLTLLYVALRRRHTALRLGGLALFGVSLAKLFLYDLSRLSSITRALSFLAVGAVLLLGGFFYQRLGVRLDEREKAA